MSDLPDQDQLPKEEHSLKTPPSSGGVTPPSSIGESLTSPPGEASVFPPEEVIPTPPEGTTQVSHEETIPSLTEETTPSVETAPPGETLAPTESPPPASTPIQEMKTEPTPPEGEEEAVKPVWQEASLSAEQETFIPKSPSPVEPISPVLAETPPEELAETPPPSSPPAEPTETFHSEKRSLFSLIKKIVPFLLIAFVILGVFFVVFRQGLPQVGRSREIILTYWGLWEPEGVIKEVIAEWEKENPDIKVSYVQQTSREYRERLQSALARGEGPDIFRFHNTWLPMLKNELDPMPAEVMDASTFERVFYPVVTSSLRSGVNYLGLPLEIDTLALFYNQDFFSAAGVSPPQTWDDLRQAAYRLTIRNEGGEIQRAGVAMGTTGNVWHWSDILGLMMLQNGADLTNPTGSLAEDALTYYTIFSKTDRVWNDTLPSSILAFATGKAAMIFGFSWDVFEVKSLNANLNFKVVPVPQLPGNEINWASFWVEGVAQKSENTQEAWDFLKFLSSKEIMEKLYQAQSKVRLFGEPYSRVEMAGSLQTDPLAAPFVSQAPKAQTWYLCSRTFDNGINDRMIKYFEDAVNAVNKGSSPESALNTAASGVAQILSQYGLGTYTVR